MRRPIGVVLVAALAFALGPSVARASLAFPPPSSYDLRQPVLQSFFGERSDAAASLAASYGDRASESPLRDLAFRPSALRGFPATALAAAPFATAAPAPVAQPSDYAAIFGGRVLQPSAQSFVPVSFDAPAGAVALAPDRIANVPSMSRAPLAVGSYEPETFVTPEPGTQTFDRVATPAAASAPVPPAALASGRAGPSILVPVSTHVGRLQFAGNDGAQTQQLLSLNDNAYGADATFGVRAGQRQVNVGVSSSYEHLMRDDTTAYSSAALAADSWQIGGNSAPALPNYADVSKLALGANVAVPVTRTLTLNLNYDAQRLLGGYGLPGLVNLDATDNSYGGNLTFAIPRWSSEISVGARQYHYQDNLAPVNTFSDTRENVNFTVKF